MITAVILFFFSNHLAIKWQSTCRFGPKTTKFFETSGIVIAVLAQYQKNTRFAPNCHHYLYTKQRNRNLSE